MFKSVMTSARIHEISSGSLLDIPEPLELRCVNDGNTYRMKLHVTMDTVVENLVIRWHDVVVVGHLGSVTKTRGVLFWRQRPFHSTWNIQPSKYDNWKLNRV